MNKSGYIEILISGKTGNLPLSPDGFDIREIALLFETVEGLLFPEYKKSRPLISYKIEEGSVRNIFQTTLQYIIGFDAVLMQIPELGNIDFLDLRTAVSIETMQDLAIEKNYSIVLSTSLENNSVLVIDKTTHYYRAENLWADAEYYLYGKITNAGGKEKANIHLLTEDFGTLRIATPIPFLDTYPENILYKPFGVRVTAKQNINTGELDTNSIKFLELIDHQKNFNANYIDKLRDKAKANWVGKISADQWLNDVKGDYDA